MNVVLLINLQYYSNSQDIIFKCNFKAPNTNE